MDHSRSSRQTLVCRAPDASNAAPNRMAASSTSPSPTAFSKGDVDEAAINITISNCVFEGCQGYALESEDGAQLEDITITNTTMRDLVSGPIFMRLGSRLRGPKESTKVGTFKRILISNLDCYNAAFKVGSILSGIPGYSIEDVKLSNIYVETVGGGAVDAANVPPPEFENKYPDPGMFGTMPAFGFFLRHVRNIEMSHVELASTAPDARPAFYLT